jgi:hypothetical protein
VVPVESHSASVGEQASHVSRQSPHQPRIQLPRQLRNVHVAGFASGDDRSCRRHNIFREDC